MSLEGALIGGGSLLGAGLSGGLGFASALQQQKAVKSMFKNRYQWTMQDLRKAGLNPMLAIGGSGPPVASMGQASVPDLGSAVSSGVSNALQHRRQTEEFKNLEEQRKLSVGQRLINKQLEMKAQEDVTTARETTRQLRLSNDMQQVLRDYAQTEKGKKLLILLQGGAAGLPVSVFTDLFGDLLLEDPPPQAVKPPGKAGDKSPQSRFEKQRGGKRDPKQRQRGKKMESILRRYIFGP